MNSISLEKLQSKWYKILKDTGFKDIEASCYKNDLNRRSTVAFTNKERLLNFHLALGAFLNKSTIPRHHRTILRMYGQGKHVLGKGGIVELTGYSDRGIRKIISKYKDIICKK